MTPTTDTSDDGPTKRRTRRPAMLAEATDGRRASLARLLTMVERGGDGARAVGRVAHPLGGRAYTVGITGAPGAGQVDAHQRLVQSRPYGAPMTTVGRPIASPCSPSTRRRRSPAARSSATASAWATSRRRRRVHPLDGHPRSPRRPVARDAVGRPGARRRRVSLGASSRPSASDRSRWRSSAPPTRASWW